VSTAILLFTKTNSGGTDNVWFYDMQADGFSLDDKRNALISEEQLEAIFNTPDKVAAEVVDKCDIPFILNDWKTVHSELNTEHFKDRTQKSFLIPKADIVANDYDLSINRYKEVVYEEVQYEKPSVLIQEIKALQADNAKMLLDLEKMLG
jgi:type I restriction enzyme M protein